MKAMWQMNGWHPLVSINNLHLTVLLWLDLATLNQQLHVLGNDLTIQVKYCGIIVIRCSNPHPKTHALVENFDKEVQVP
jgi:hypothetical protein